MIFDNLPVFMEEISEKVIRAWRLVGAHVQNHFLDFLLSYLLAEISVKSLMGLEEKDLDSVTRTMMIMRLPSRKMKFELMNMEGKQSRIEQKRVQLRTAKEYIINLSSSCTFFFSDYFFFFFLAKLFFSNLLM
ncbi:hypothetical protein LINPERHAP1_LOCUS21108, partial [Linum perenne]